MLRFFSLSFLFAGLLLAGCATEEKDPTAKMTPEEVHEGYFSSDRKGFKDTKGETAADEDTMASLEMMAGRALTELNEIKGDLKKQLEEVKQELETASLKIRDTYKTFG